METVLEIREDYQLYQQCEIFGRLEIAEILTKVREELQNQLCRRNISSTRNTERLLQTTKTFCPVVSQYLRLSRRT